MGGCCHEVYAGRKRDVGVLFHGAYFGHEAAGDIEYAASTAIPPVKALSMPDSPNTTSAGSDSPEAYTAFTEATWAPEATSVKMYSHLSVSAT